MRTGLTAAAARRGLYISLSNCLTTRTHRHSRCLQAFKVVSARVFGSPQSFAALRSRSKACWHALGPWTMMVNLNPSELNSAFVFEVGIPRTAPVQLRLCSALREAWPYQD